MLLLGSFKVCPATFNPWQHWEQNDDVGVTLQLDQISSSNLVISSGKIFEKEILLLLPSALGKEPRD